jgi:beta-lactamase regulating signal transducer with metallopeptidase domain
VRLLVSEEVGSPMSWGFAKPVILLDVDTLERPEDAEAILAHEMAHVERNDWAVLMPASPPPCSGSTLWSG